MREWEREMVHQTVSDLAFSATQQADKRKIEQSVEDRVCHRRSLNVFFLPPVAVFCMQLTAPTCNSAMPMTSTPAQDISKEASFTNQTVTLESQKVKVKVGSTVGVNPISYPVTEILLALTQRPWWKGCVFGRCEGVSVWKVSAHHNECAPCALHVRMYVCMLQLLGRVLGTSSKI